MKTASELMEQLRDGSPEKKQATAERALAEIELRRVEAKLALARKQLAQQRQAEQTNLELEYLQAKADLDRAAERFARTQKLAEQNFVPQSQVKADEATMRRLQQQCLSLQQKLDGLDNGESASGVSTVNPKKSSG